MLIEGLIDVRDVSVLNVTGPQESQREGVYRFVKASIARLLNGAR